MRAVASILAAAASTSLALRLWFPFPPNDPLAGTLAALPLVAALFWSASRLAGRLLPDHSGSRLGAAIALAAVAGSRGNLGLRWEESLGPPVLAAGLFILLFWQAAAQIFQAARRPSPDASQLSTGVSPRISSRYGSFAALVLAVYVGVAPWSIGERPPDGDEPWYLLLTHSLASDFDTDLANNYETGDSLGFMPRRIAPQPGDPVGSDGELYSRHNMTLPVVLAPAYKVAGRAGAVAVMLLLTAWFATWQVAVADRLFPERPREVLLAGAAAAVASPLLLYSHQIWVEAPAALAVVCGFDGVLGVRKSRTVRPTDAVKIAVAVVVLPLLKLRFLALAAGLVAVAFRHSRRSVRVRMGFVALGLLAATAAILLFNQFFFGSALKYHTLGSLASYWTAPVSYLRAPLGLVFDGAFGLLGSAPVWLLALPGLVLLWRRQRSTVADAALVSVPYLLLLGPRSEWFGGWSPPFRYGLVFLPFLLLLLVPVLARLDRRPVRTVASLLLATTLCLGLIALVVPGWTYNFGDGRSYLLDALTVDFGADVARFVPSWVRPRAANFFWLAAVAAAAVLLAGRLRTRAGPGAVSLGAGALLAFMALLPVASAELPLRTLEFEDPYVSATGGELYPPRWTIARAVYRGSWHLAPGDVISSPIDPRGSSLRIELEYHKPAPDARVTLEVLAGDTVVQATALTSSDVWNRVLLDPISWPGGTRLGFRLATSSKSTVLLNRAHLDWSDGDGV